MAFNITICFVMFLFTLEPFQRKNLLSTFTQLVSTKNWSRINKHPERSVNPQKNRNMWSKSKNNSKRPEMCVQAQKCLASATLCGCLFTEEEKSGLLKPMSH